MEEFGSLWSYQDNIDELKQKLLYTTIELEKLKVEAHEELRKQKEGVNHLINLLKLAYKERDETKDQLQKVLSNLMPLHPAQPVTPLVLPAKPNSTITESSSLSDTYNHQSRISSPVDSFLDADTSPDFTSINVGNSSQMAFVSKASVQEYSANAPISTGLMPAAVGKLSKAEATIDNLVKGKILPQNGELLKAVMDAGPLLQTLLVAGPLPTWRNPPPTQNFKIPPVSIIGCEASNGLKQAANELSATSTSHNETCVAGMPRGSSQMCSASMFDFERDTSCSGLGNEWLLKSGATGEIPH